MKKLKSVFQKIWDNNERWVKDRFFKTDNLLVDMK